MRLYNKWRSTEGTVPEEFYGKYVYWLKVWIPAQRVDNKTLWVTTRHLIDEFLSIYLWIFEWNLSAVWHLVFVLQRFPTSIIDRKKCRVDVALFAKFRSVILIFSETRISAPGNKPWVGRKKKRKKFAEGTKFGQWEPILKDINLY